MSGLPAPALMVAIAAIGLASSECLSRSTNQGSGGAGTGSGGDSGAAGATAGGSGATGGGGSGGTGGGLAGDAAVDVITSDACVSPEVVTAFDASAAGGNGIACNSANITGDADSIFAGLDCMPISQPSTYIDGQPVCGCVGVDFGSELSLDPLFIRARATSNACGTPCSGTRCDTGHDMLVFKGSPGAYTFVQTIQQIATVPGDYPIASLGGPTRYVVICRFAYGPDRDDIEVDAVYSQACR